SHNFNRVTTADMTIAWDLVVDGNKFQAGSTKNRLYVTYSLPENTRPLYETVLQTGCVYNGGPADSTGSVLTNVRKTFDGLKILRANRSPSDFDPYLQYYRTYDLSEVTTELLLRNGTG